MPKYAFNFAGSWDVGIQGSKLDFLGVESWDLGFRVSSSRSGVWGPNP